MGAGGRIQQEHEQALERTSPNSRIVHAAILEEGNDELARPSSALFWSAIAAGLSMGLSLIGQGLLRAYLPDAPDAPWRPLVASFGYAMGFLVVVLGRQQLFTENTLTAVLPLMHHKDLRTAINMLRLWTVVLAGNLIGTAVFACFIAWGNTFDAQVKTSFLELAREATRHGFANAIARGVIAGWMIALMVWMQPFADAGRFWVVLSLTYFVGLGSLTHVVAGALEAFLLSAAGERTWLDALVGYVLPALIGNTIGGVTLVAAINHAQVVSGHGEVNQTALKRSA